MTHALGLGILLSLTSGVLVEYYLGSKGRDVVVVVVVIVFAFFGTRIKDGDGVEG